MTRPAPSDMDDSDRDFWNDRRVFVTGSTGFLGSWLTERLVELDAVVVGLVRDVPPRERGAMDLTPRAAAHVLGCVEDEPLLERALNEHEIETVFHLAAQPIVGTALRSPLSTFEANIRGTYNLLEACRRVATVKRIVIASSDKAYGAHARLPYDETMPLEGRHPYDVTKSCADLIAQAYHHTYGLPVCITRCGNFFGGRDLNFNRLIPGTIRSVINEAAPVIRSDDSYVRDYLYVRDAVGAYLDLARRMDDAALHGEAFNFGLETQVSVREVTERILALMGRYDLTPTVLNEAPGEIHRQSLSAEKATRVLGWRPRYGLDEALAETIAWYRRYFGAGAGRADHSPTIHTLIENRELPAAT